MNASKTIRVYGDNGGQIHMTDGEIVVSGFEADPSGNLIRDVLTFDDWKDEATVRSSYAEMASLLEHPSTEEIARFGGRELVINVRAVGIAGRHYAGLPVECVTW